jgi:hypothetical protein
MIEKVKTEIENVKSQKIKSTKVVQEAEAKNKVCMETEEDALMDIED